MQMKHLIVFAVVGMVALLGFNLINGNQRDKNRASITTSSNAEQSATSTVVPSTDNAITSKPLGEQPKAILDSATTQIDQAQQADQQRIEQMGSAQ